MVFEPHFCGNDVYSLSSMYVCAGLCNSACLSDIRLRAVLDLIVCNKELTAFRSIAVLGTIWETTAKHTHISHCKAQTAWGPEGLVSK